MNLYNLLIRRKVCSKFWYAFNDA